MDWIEVIYDRRGGQGVNVNVEREGVFIYCIYLSYVIMININLDVLCYLQIFNFKSENLNIVYFK